MTAAVAEISGELCSPLLQIFNMFIGVALRIGLF